jgi:hypothetical protein
MGNDFARVALAALVLSGLCGGASAEEPQEYRPPKTGFGAPDLQGIWTNQSITGLTRPPGVAALTVTAEEAERIVASNFWVRAGENQDQPVDTATAPEAGDGARFGDQGYNSFWLDPGNTLARIKGEFRTSWITVPANGQMPLSQEARRRIGAYNQRRAGTSYMDGGNFANPEELPISERCLIGFSGTGGPVMLNPIYNSNYQIVQTPSHVMIMAEMVHDVRIIPLGGRHRPASMPQWLGDSVGRYEGDTLIVETRNVHPEQALSGPLYLSAEGKVSERFTRTSETEILYEFSVDDPLFYTQTWGGEMVLNAKSGPIYEYACHEGNYSVPGILAGSRVFEAKEAAAAAPGAASR